jgi:hypothetical protein
MNKYIKGLSKKSRKSIYRGLRQDDTIYITPSDYELLCKAIISNKKNHKLSNEKFADILSKKVSNAND